MILVGAGPGDPGLITVRGLEAIRQADVILYDLLVSHELMEEFPPGAETIFVGKEAGTHYVDQAETNALLVQKAKPGKTVVRLKGGDPYTFGRGGEEAEACARAGIPFEVVPGVTSGIAAPAYAGIPVTHRDASSSIALITGHRRSDGTVRTIPAPRADTLIYYMGVRTLPQIVKALRREGWPANTPAAMVHRGTTPRQLVVAGTLANIVKRATEAQIRHPALVVVGKVAAYRKRLRWFEDRPLLGRRILIAEALPEAKELRDELYRLGAEVTCLPSPALSLLARTPKLDAAIKKIKQFQVLLLAHPLAVQVFFQRLAALGLDARALAYLQIAAYGRATQVALQEHLIRSDRLIPLEFSSAQVAPLRRRKVLLPDSAPGPHAILEALKKIRAEVSLVPAYAALPAPALTKVPVHQELIVFPARQGVEELLSQVVLPIYVHLAALGPAAASALQARGLTPALSLRSADNAAAVAAILRWAKPRRRRFREAIP
ncbi:MAG: uroporphyrinogen-III C-methyltransferase [Deltaproteobacteria bacterium RBG_13_61_14]|nr:MAG: uroporphyrinogen-III C-methyltransferase [Deltaproteobacteria bacterium RBG_13_61_14]